MTHNDTVRHIKDKPHSYEFGKAGRRFKLYFDNLQQLRDQIDALIKWGMTSEEDAYIVDTKGVKEDGRV